MNMSSQRYTLFPWKNRIREGVRKVSAQRRFISTTTICLSAIFIVACAIRLYHLERVEMILDEHCDIPLAISYLHNPNPFSLNDGHKIDDITQTRLPFYITALSLWFFAPEATREQSPLTLLPSVRFPSALFGALTVLIVYLLGAELYDKRTGLIASALLALSTYHIGLSRLSVTSGGSYGTFFYLLSLLFFYKATKKEDGKYFLISGVTTGLACASMLGSAILIPTFLFFLLIYYRKSLLALSFNIRARDITSVSLLNIFLVILFIGIMIFWQRHDLSAASANRVWMIFLAISFLYICGLFWVISRMHYPIGREGMGMVLLNMVSLSIIFFFIASPIHLRPMYFLEMIGWLKRYGYNNAFSQHFLSANPTMIIFFRLPLPFNLFFLAGLAYHLFHLDEEANSYILLALSAYLLLLSSLHWFTSHYAMSIVPLAYLISARMFTVSLTTLKTLAARAFIICSGVIGFIYMSHIIISLSPYYHMDGYKLGQGYRGHNQPSIITTEGVRDAVLWMSKNIPEHSRVGLVMYYRWLPQKIVIHKTLIYIAQYNDKKLDFGYADDMNDLASYDYLMVSSVFPKKWNNESASFYPVHTIYLSHLETIKIYKNTMHP